MVIYEAISSNHFSPETGAYVSFGISARDLDHGQVSYVPDVFLKEQEALDFIERMRQLQVEPIHLVEIIEDMLGL